MTIGNRVKIAMTAIGETLDDFSEKLGVAKSTLVNYRSGKTQPKDDFLKQLSEIYSIDLAWLQTGDGEMFGRGSSIAELPFDLEPTDSSMVKIPLLDVHASAGSGILNFDPESVEWFWVMRRLLFPYTPDQIRAVYVSGDSMEPTLYDGDIALCAEGVVDNSGIYIINVGGELRVKRLHFFLDGRISVMSDNKKYPEEMITPEMLENDGIFIVGRVIKRFGDV